MRHRQDQDSRVLRLGKSVSSRPRGSLTVEAALCLPLFFLAALLLMLLLETAALSVKIRGAARYAAQATAAAQIENPVVLDRGKLQADLISALGAGRVDENILIGGRPPERHCVAAGLDRADRRRPHFLRQRRHAGRRDGLCDGERYCLS